MQRGATTPCRAPARLGAVARLKMNSARMKLRHVSKRFRLGFTALRKKGLERLPELIEPQPEFERQVAAVASMLPRHGPAVREPACFQFDEVLAAFSPERSV